jgi:tRNA pseudouridine38/39 synthase
MIDSGTLHKLLTLLRPDATLTKKTARFLAADLRKAAQLCDSFGDDRAPAPDPASPEGSRQGPPTKRQKAVFDFSKFQSRPVVLRLLYIGWKYHGFPSQDHDENTVEGHLFRALERTCLLPPNSVWSDINYTRCGRTDVGVSALCQVLTINLRSKAPLDAALPSHAHEIDYPFILNKTLPDEIRITGWKPAEPNFHARFSATYREYKYFIPGSHSNCTCTTCPPLMETKGTHENNSGLSIPHAVCFLW